MSRFTDKRLSVPIARVDTRFAFVELLQASRLMAVILNLGAKITYSNASFSDATGWSYVDLAGAVWQDVLAPLGIGNLRNLFDDLLAGNASSWHEENEILTRDGRSLFIRWNYFLFRNAAGEVDEVGCIGEDVTERVLLARKLTAESCETLRELQRNLHDGLGQELFGISMTAKSLATMMQRGQVVSAADLLSMANAANTAMDTCRHLSRNLAITSEVNGDLVGALKRLMAKPPLLDGPQMRFDAKVLNSIVLSPVASEHIYKIAQEAVTNAIKHSRASTVALRVNVRARRIVVEIEDDGIGMCSGALSGIGLRLMKYRAGLLHAVLRIEAAPAGGVIVRLRSTIMSNR